MIFGKEMLVCEKCLAIKPSMASLMPAATKTMKAGSVLSDTISQTTRGTDRIRPMVMILGRLMPIPDVPKQ